jgi:uncharacterized protein (DUF4415 family)
MVYSMKNSKKEKNLLADDSLAASNGKVRITTYIDIDVYERLQDEAAVDGKKYQTLLNEYLRAAVMKELSKSDLKKIKIALS